MTTRRLILKAARARRWFGAHHVHVGAVLMAACLVLAVSSCQRSATDANENSPMYGTSSTNAPEEPVPSVDPAADAAGRQAITAALFTAEACLFKQVDYCVRDADFVDPLITAVLDKYYGGVMPTDPDHVAEVQSSVFSRYRDALMAPEGLRRVEKRLEVRFDQPIIDDAGGTVTIDFGVVPGRLTVGPRWSVGVSESSHLVDGQWRAAEIGERLKRYVAAYPQASSIRLKITVPARVWIYDYRRSEDRILVITGDSPTRALATPGVLGRRFDRLIDGSMSLHTRDLAHVKLSNFPP